MNGKRTYKLLTKTVLIYLVITFLAFILIGYYLIREANNYIHDDLEHKFERQHHKVLLHLDHSDDLDGFLEKWYRNVFVQKLDIEPDLSLYPICIDTLIYTQEADEYQNFRMKTYVDKTEKGFFKTTIIRPVQEFYNFRDDIFGTILPAFFVLASFMVLFNLFLSNALFLPFYKILDQMKRYKVGKGGKISEVNTTTYEFDKMQALYRGMVEQIDDDFKNLKEYTEDLAHELQTPLAIIRNKIDNLIANPMVMENEAKSIQSIYEEVNHLSKMAEGLNLLTKIENKEFADRQILKTKELILNHIEAVKELAALKSIEIKTELDPNHEFKIDPFLFNTLLKNLIRNAIHYCESNGNIEISSGKDSEFTISNDGPPLKIAEEQIFERFKHAPGVNQSLGLGLSIVQKICESSNLDLEYSYVDKKHNFKIQKLD